MIEKSGFNVAHRLVFPALCSQGIFLHYYSPGFIREQGKGLSPTGTYGNEN